MGLGQFVDRLYRTITPRNNRVLGGTFITHLPATPAIAGTAEGVTLTPGAGIAAYGNYAAIATAKALPTECWIEGLEMRIAGSALAERIVGLVTGTATGLGNAANMEAQVGGWIAIAAAAPGPLTMYLPLRPPVYVRAPTAAETAAGAQRIACAVAAAGAGLTVDVKLTLSNRK